MHNLEHGGIVIQYGDDIPRPTVDELTAWYRNDPNGIMIAPFPELGDRSRSAPGRLPSRAAEEPGTRVPRASAPRFDEDAFDAFKDAYGYRGPERFPRELLTPRLVVSSARAGVAKLAIRA